MRTPWSELAERVARGGVVAGVLSGTSADGIDVGLMRFEASERDVGRPEPIAFTTVPFEPELAGRVRAVLDGDAVSDGEGAFGLGALARLDRDLGRAFGAAVRSVAEGAGVEPVLAGSHGQTVWHHDGLAGGADAGADGSGLPTGAMTGPATLQLGCADELAQVAGCAVAADFRRADIAAGGEGAPLSPLADPLIFRGLPRPAAILNLGGIANLTWLTGGGPPTGFDTGPAGSLLDGLARRLLGAPCDLGGAAALSGRADARLVDELCAHPFLRRQPPKSTGRDTFGEAWVDGVLARARALGLARDADVLASAVDFVARHVAEGFAGASGAAVGTKGGEGGADRGAENESAAPLVVAGGGLHNRALWAALERRCGGPVLSAADFGVDPDAREALVFGVLAARCAQGVPSPLPRVTGAREERVLGRLSGLPPRRVEV